MVARTLGTVGNGPSVAVNDRGFELEVCVDRVEDALLAIDAGATRIELNSALALDGLTPSLGSCRWLRQQTQLPIIAMLRPHAAGFYYTESEKVCLLEDCQALLDVGMDGIAFGAADLHGNLDWEILERVAAVCGEAEVVLHRVFDELEDPTATLVRLEGMGFQRILTSGGALTALEGLEALLALQNKTAIEILPGSGIHCGNAREICLRMSPCEHWRPQLHGSFRVGENRPIPQQIANTQAILQEFAHACD